MRSVVLALAFVAIAFAGCSQDEGSDDVLVPPVVVVPSAFEAICPPGESSPNAQGVCVGRIVSRTESNQEPYLAIDPERPNVMAIGVNAGHTAYGLRAMPRPGFALVLMDIFVSEDGGATWRLVQHPYVPDEAVSVGPADVSVVGDPALVFDANGVLHVSGIANHSPLRGYNVFYTSTPDLGATWTDPIVLTEDDDNDRNWMDLGPDGTLYVAWQNVGESTQIAWSGDGGSTWTVSRPLGNCILPGRLAFLAGMPLVACAGISDGDITGVRPHLFDRHADAFVDLGDLREVRCAGAQPHVINGTIVILAAGFCNAPGAAVSLDRGATWRQEPLSKITGLDVSWLYWTTTDRWGHVHALIGAGGSVHHVALDTDLNVVSTIQLRGPQAQGPNTDTIAPSWGDHFYGLEFVGDQGMAVWTRDRGLDYASIVPVMSTVPDVAAP